MRKISELADWVVDERRLLTQKELEKLPDGQHIMVYFAFSGGARRYILRWLHQILDDAPFGTPCAGLVRDEVAWGNAFGETRKMLERDAFARVLHPVGSERGHHRVWLPQPERRLTREETVRTVHSAAQTIIQLLELAPEHDHGCDCRPCRIGRIGLCWLEQSYDGFAPSSESSEGKACDSG